MSLLKVALLACTASALAPQQRKSGVRVKAAQKVAGNVLAASSFLGLVIAQPAYASIESAAVNVADSAYPIIEKLQKKDVAPVVSKALGAALGGDPVSVLKVAKAADEALISTDPAKLVAVLKAVEIALVDALNAHLHHANRALGPVKTPKGYEPPPETPRGLRRERTLLATGS